MWDGVAIMWRCSNDLRFLMTDLPSEGISFGTTPVDNQYTVGQQINCTAGGNPAPLSYLWTDRENSQDDVQGQVLDLSDA